MNIKHILSIGALLCCGTLYTSAMAWKAPDANKNKTVQFSQPDDPYKHGFRGMKQLSLNDLKAGKEGIAGWNTLSGKKGDAGDSVAHRLNHSFTKIGSKMHITQIQEDFLGNRHFRMMQYYKEIPVIGSDIIVHVNKQNEIYLVSGNFSPDISLDLTSIIKESTAIENAQRYLSNSTSSTECKASLVVFDSIVSYEIIITASEPEPARWKVYVDARTGAILGTVDQLFRAAPGLQGSHVPVTGSRLTKEDGTLITITGWHDTLANYFLYHKNEKWGVFNLVTSDWEQRSTPSWETNDRAAISLAKNFSITQNFVTTKLGRNSFNNSGTLAQANVHEGTSYVNAYWDGSDFHFGDGDNVSAGPLTTLDISAHEYGHAITQYTSNLVYSYESGALNESFSDVFGTWVEFWAQPDGRSAYPQGIAGRADWLCGEDAWMAGDALRDLRDPLRFENPSYYQGTYWYTGSGDNGGVHYNSGVQNKAFYLLAEGGSGSNDGHPYNLTRIGIDTAGQIAMYANMYLLTSSSQYRDARNAWIQAAVTLGYNSNLVSDAWAAVGILPLVSHLSASPISLSFDSVGVGVSDTMIITLSNNGGDATLISSLTFNNPAFTAATTVPFSVAGGATLPLRIVFRPTVTGSVSGNLTISSNAQDNPSITIALTGSAVNPAGISITPSFFNRTVPVGDSTFATLTIANSGQAILNWTITTTDNTFTSVAPSVYDENHFLPLEKGAVDTRVGHPVTTLRGGPDRTGYTWIDSDENGGPAYQWNDIRTSGTFLSTVSGCDDCFQMQRLSFRFPFYGNSFDTMYVSSNGYITFVAGNSQYNNFPLPSTSAPANLIAAFFDDLHPGNGGDIYFRDYGDRAVVQFDNVYPYNGSGVYTFQLVLEPSGNIYLYYNNLTGPLTSATAGIQNGTRDDGLTVVYNATYLKNALAVKFSPKSSWLTATPLTGTVSAGQSASVQVGFNGASVPGGTYYGQLMISHNAPNTPTPLSVPCTLRVDGIRRLSATPATVNFNSRWVGSRDSAIITLSNSGDEATVVSSITGSNTHFSYGTSLPLTVSAFGTATLKVYYQPATIGNHTANITINSDAEDNPSISLSCSGIGVTAPSASVRPDSLYYNLLPSDAASTQVCYVRNTGGDTLQYRIQGINQLSSPVGAAVSSGIQPPQLRNDIIYSSDNLENNFVNGRVILGTAEGFSSPQLSSLDKVGYRNIRELGTARNPRTGLKVSTSRKPFLVTLSDTTKEGVLKAIELLKNEPSIAYAEPDYVLRAYATPNDTYFSQLYAMFNNGQTGGTVDADIDATEVWDRHTGNRSILIGIIDTGIDYVHPDLAANIWTNPGEIAGNGIDDDHNGFVDDIHGWDFAYDDSNPTDGHYHGTHCAGTIAGIGNNGIGVAGVMWTASLVALKFLDDSGSGTTTDAIDAVNYANAMGIQITSNSWGGGGFSQALMDAIAAGGLFIAAAGNNGTDNDASPQYPASYSLDNIISVAATDHSDLMASFSCYGRTSVDLGAPGVNIYSCQPGSRYQTLSGTSMATPHVSGSAGLIWSYNPFLSASQVKQLLLENVDPVSSLNGRCVTGGRLNIDRALRAAGPTWLTASPMAGGRVAPGDSAVVSVTVTPTGLLGGRYEGEIMIGTDDPLHQLLRVAATADIEGFRSLRASQSSIDFGSKWVGLHDTVQLQLINSGNEATTVTSLSFNEASFITSTQLPLIIPPFGSIEIMVIFNPQTPGAHTGILTIASTAGDNPVIAIELQGTGTTAPEILVNPEYIDETVLSGDTIIRTLTVTNAGGADLSFTVSPEFLTSPSTGLSDSAKITAIREIVEKSITQSGIRNRALTIHEGKNEYITGSGDMVLSDEADIAYTKVNPEYKATSSLNILVAGSPSTSTWLQDIVNKLSATGQFSSVTSLHVGTVTPSLATLNTFDAVMVFRDGNYLNPTALGDTLAAYVDAGGAVVTTVFEVANNNLAGRWTNDYRAIVSSSQTNGPLLTLGTVPLPNHPIMNGVSRFSGGTSSYRAGSITLLPGCEVVANWSNGDPLIVTREVGRSRRVDLNFYPVSSTSRSDFWDTTTDGSLIMANALKWAAGVSNWLSITPNSGTVTAGTSFELHVKLDAREIMGGDYTANLNFSHNSPGNVNPLVIPVHMYVDGIRRLVASPASVNLPATWIGMSDTAQITLTNSGTEATTITSITSSNSNFSTIALMPLVIGPISDTTIRIVYQPLLSGNHTGALTINSNAEDNPVVNVELSGTAITGPSIVITPQQVNVSLAAGGSTERTVTIANAGGADLIWNTSHRTGGIISRETHDTIPGVQARAYTATHDLSCTAWSDAGNDAFDSFGNPRITVGAVSSSICMLEGDSSYTINGYRVRVRNDFAENHIYRSIIEPHPSETSTRSDITVSLSGNMGSDGAETVYLDSVSIGGKWVRFYVNQVSYPNSDPRVVFLIVPSKIEHLGNVLYSHSADNLTMEARNISLPATVYIIPSFHDLSAIKTWFQNELTMQSTWLTVTPASGTTQGGQISTMQFTFNATGLTDGLYYDTISVSHNSLTQISPLQIPVELHVGAIVPGISGFITSIGVSALPVASGTRFRIVDVRAGSPVAGKIQGNRYTAILR
jgi:Zn-dependent metalloprotease/subtilisin family serine protease